MTNARPAPVEAARSSARVKVLDGCAFALGALSLAAVMCLSVALATDVGEALTRNTVRLALVWYVTALCIFMWLAPADWSAAGGAGRFARWCWTWALVCFLVHVAMAFHHYHDWSHGNAFEHTRKAGGIGEGIYASYLFTCLWTADAIWWWVWPDRYAARSRWFDRALHGFMLFMVFNATIVFESGATRWAGVCLFVALAAIGLGSRKLLLADQNYNSTSPTP